MTESPNRLINPQPQPDDRLDVALRPRRLNDLIGQNRVKDNLGILIDAARQRSEPLDHVFFYGPPGLGKTTLAHILANEMGVNIKITAGPAIERPGDLAAILPTCAPGMCFSLTKSTAWGGRLRKCSTPPWRTLPWILSSAKVLRRARSA